MSERKIDAKSDVRPDTLHWGAGRQVKELEARGVLSPQRNPLAQVICRLGDGACADAHAAALNRATGSRPSRSGQSLMQLQRQYGNCYVRQVVALAERVEGADGRVQRAARPPEFPLFHTPPANAAPLAPQTPYLYPLPPAVAQAVTDASDVVEGAPRSYESDLFLIYSVRQLAERDIAEATMNFFYLRFSNVFDMLAQTVRYDILSDFPDDPVRGEEEFRRTVVDTVYWIYLFPIADDYFDQHPNRLRQLRQRRIPHVGPGEELA